MRLPVFVKLNALEGLEGRGGTFSIDPGCVFYSYLQRSLAFFQKNLIIKIYYLNVSIITLKQVFEMSSKRPSLKMIAEQAKTSIGTVSGVLNGVPGFSEERRKQVWDIAASLNYQPNKDARSLRQGTSANSLGRAKTGIIMHLSHKPGSLDNINVKFEMFRNFLLSRDAQRNGLNIFHYWYDNVAFSCQPLINGLVDGAIVGTPHLKLIEILRDYKAPVVLLDVPFSLELAGEAMVNFDMRLGMLMLLRRLREFGHRHIAVFRIMGDSSKIDYHGSRWFKLLEANATEGLELDMELSRPRVISAETHERVVSEFAEEAAPKIRAGIVSAVMCLDDIYAVSVSEELEKKHGLRAPEDYSLTGFARDGSSMTNTKLTSITDDWPSASAEAVRMLKDIIARPEAERRERLIKPSLFEGGTIKKISGGVL
jgi:LacI family transcriptional regulator